MNPLLLADVVRQALMEDLGAGDITTETIFTEAHLSRGVFVAKAPGVIAGLPVVAEVYRQLDTRVDCQLAVRDGAAVIPGTVLANVTGPTVSLLGGERVALNFLQRLSGIASQTANLVQLAVGYPAKITDTRKTTPGLRFLEKYAVRQGGGVNHRFNLADAILIKDNHIAACGSITEAVRRARKAAPHTMTIEVETENEAQVLEALTAGADIIMLDNMTPAEMTRMVRLINHRAVVEASGNINETTLRDVAGTGVDIISCGSLTHSVRALDISLDFSPEF